MGQCPKMGHCPKMGTPLSYTSTIIFAMKEKLWQNRNALNFDETVEHERLEEAQMRRQIATHIRLNNTAQNDNKSVETVMDMTPDDRKRWMRATKDRGTTQCAIDQFFSRENTPLTRLTADDHQDLLAQHPDSAPTAATSTQLKIRFPRAPPQSSVQIGGLNRQQYAELVKTHQCPRSAQHRRSRNAWLQHSSASAKQPSANESAADLAALAERVHRIQVPPL